MPRCFVGTLEAIRLLDHLGDAERGVERQTLKPIHLGRQEGEQTEPGELIAVQVEDILRLLDRLVVRGEGLRRDLDANVRRCNRLLVMIELVNGEVDLMLPLLASALERRLESGRRRHRLGDLCRGGHRVRERADGVTRLFASIGDRERRAQVGYEVQRAGEEAERGFDCIDAACYMPRDLCVISHG